MEEMQMTEVARLIEGLRSAGWNEKKINDFLLYIETGKEEYKPTNQRKVTAFAVAFFYGILDNNDV